MQSSARLLILAGLATAALFSNSASAQLFGNRGSPANSAPNAGMPSNSMPRAGTTAPAGQTSMGISRPQQGVERFYRQNRSVRDFVGRSRSDMKTFVGAQQALAVGQVRSATEGLRPDASNSKRINRPIPPQPNKGMYYPKLEVDLNTDNYDDAVINAPVESQVLDRESLAALIERLNRVGGPSIQLDLSDTNATLSGQVDSQRKRELIEQLVSFEPGIDKVVNQLVIVKPVR